MTSCVCKDILIDEWIWHYLAGDKLDGKNTAKDKTNAALKLVCCIYRQQLKVLCLEDSPFLKKYYHTLSALKDKGNITIFKLIRNLYPDSNLWKNITHSDIQETGGAPPDCVKDDDLYLWKILCKYPDTCFITTDEPLIECINQNNIPCIFTPKDFLERYCSKTHSCS